MPRKLSSLPWLEPMPSLNGGLEVLLQQEAVFVLGSWLLLGRLCHPGDKESAINPIPLIIDQLHGSSAESPSALVTLCSSRSARQAARLFRDRHPSSQQDLILLMQLEFM